MSYCLIYATFADCAEAERIGQKLIEEKLAACVNIFPSHTAIYEWQGKICNTSETAMIIKTLPSNFKKIEKTITMMHSYETCCILQLPIEKGNKAFLEWIAAQTR